MTIRIRAHPTTSERFSKFLKPGALAHLRDSKISARSHRLLSQLSSSLLMSTFPPSAIQIGDAECLDQLARFSSPIYGPQRFGRKKLLAAKSSVFLLGFTAASSVMDSEDSNEWHYFSGMALLQEWHYLVDIQTVAAFICFIICMESVWKQIHLIYHNLSV